MSGAYDATWLQEQPEKFSHVAHSARCNEDCVMLTDEETKHAQRLATRFFLDTRSPGAVMNRDEVIVVKLYFMLLRKGAAT